MKKRTAILLTTGMVGILYVEIQRRGTQKEADQRKVIRYMRLNLLLMTRLRQSGWKICKKQATR